MGRKTNNGSVGSSQPSKGRGVLSKKDPRPYSAPRVLSAEDMEAMAAGCDPPQKGKDTSPPNPCGKPSRPLSS